MTDFTDLYWHPRLLTDTVDEAIADLEAGRVSYEKFQQRGWLVTAEQMRNLRKRQEDLRRRRPVLNLEELGNAEPTSNDRGTPQDRERLLNVLLS